MDKMDAEFGYDDFMEMEYQLTEEEEKLRREKILEEEGRDMASLYSLHEECRIVTEQWRKAIRDLQKEIDKISERMRQKEEVQETEEESELF